MGALERLQNGKFGHGFIAAGFAKGIGTPIYDITGGNATAGFVATIVIGGTTSEISSGKFANGARTAAYQFLFNTLGSSIKSLLLGDRDPNKVAVNVVRGKASTPEAFDYAWRNECSNNSTFDACLAGLDMIEEYAGIDKASLPKGYNEILVVAKELGKQGYCLANANCNIMGVDQDKIYVPSFDDPKWKNEMIRRSQGKSNNNKWYERGDFMRFFLAFSFLFFFHVHADVESKECRDYKGYISALNGSKPDDLPYFYFSRGACEFSKNSKSPNVLDMELSISLGYPRAAMAQVRYLLNKKDFRQASVLLGVLSGHKDESYALTSELILAYLVTSSDVMRPLYGEHFGQVTDLAKKKLFEISELGNNEDTFGIPLISAMNASYYLALGKGFGLNEQERKILRLYADQLQVKIVGQVMGTCMDHVFGQLSANNIPHDESYFYKSCL